MKFKTLMLIKAVVALCLGLPILFAPHFSYNLLGIPLTPGGEFAAREYAASMLGVLMLTWFARNAIESEARRAIILDLCIYDAIGVVITVIAQLSGVLGPLGWVVVIIYLFFALGFGYFLLPQKKAA